jgi:hypothetical protein
VEFALTITPALHIGFPIRYDDQGEPLIYAYHISISPEVLTANYTILVAANAKTWQRGGDFAAASATTANIALLDAAKAEAELRGTESLGPAFLAELKRLTYILSPGDNGYEQLPVDIALGKNVISKDDWSEAEAFLCFFTLGFFALPRAARRDRCTRIASALNGSITSLPPLEWLASLRQSTQAKDSIEILSSEPS